MRPVTQSTDWPESWALSHHYDKLEVFGAAPRSGYEYAYRVRRDFTVDAVRRFVAPGGRVLDVAAAQGNFTLTLAEAGYDVTWNDLRSELADYVRAKYERGTVRYMPGNVFDLDVAEPFDAVLLTEVIEHVAHPDQFLAKVAGFLRPGGVIVMTTPNGAYVRNHLPRFSDCEDTSQFESKQFKPDADGHIFLLHDDEIGDVANRAGLDVQELRFYSNFLTSGHIKLNRLLKVAPAQVVHAFERFTTRLPGPVRRKVHAGTLAVLTRRGA